MTIRETMDGYNREVKTEEKTKAVPVLKHHAMKTYGGVEVQLHVFLIFALD
jgi:hypothetical protein